jgi:hypothetical protein
MNPKLYLTGSAVLMILLVLPPILDRLESSMIGVMIVQIPLLVTAGYLAGVVTGQKLKRKSGSWNANGIPGLLFGLFILFFWILPRSVDASLNDSYIKLAKLITLPLMAGIPFGVSWRRVHPVVKGAVKANLVSMLAVMGWLYLAVPVRVCNNYLLSQQNALGKTMLVIAILLALKWAIGAFAKFAHP